MFKHFENLILVLIISSSVKLVLDTYLNPNPVNQEDALLLEIS